ncbi:MAG: 2Fe-2S iron-sulfur cluster binding domain-containing protein [Deltaproteobacteria bacterium]|nr:2Fe-2S iron-sulfur cluster binding domain-containing protein [Deltaproteobacteria bacterium]
MVAIVVDGKTIEAEEGANLLQVCLENGIYIPNLCFLKEMEHPTGSCRMCLVEIDGEDKPVTSCMRRVQDGMVVRTDTEQVRHLQRIDFQLLMSAHHMDCKNCLSNKHCELKKIAKHLGVRLKATKFEELGRDLAVLKHPLFDLLPARCILCRKCLFICQQANGEPLLRLVRKGYESVIEAACEGQDPEELPCKFCMACVKGCPVSAIVPYSTYELEKSA